jgi:hypothetical protein
MNAKQILKKMDNGKNLNNSERNFLVNNGLAYFSSDIFVSQVMVLNDEGRKILSEIRREANAK